MAAAVAAAVAAEVAAEVEAAVEAAVEVAAAVAAVVEVEVKAGECLSLFSVYQPTQGRLWYFIFSFSHMSVASHGVGGALDELTSVST